MSLWILLCLVLLQLAASLIKPPSLSFEEKRRILKDENSRPNIIILFADDLGYGDMSYMGHPTLSTPNIDALAYNGKRLTQWYSGFHICSPSRASMLTGRLCVRSGCCGGWQGGVFRQNAIGGLPTNETTFATILKKAGYTTKAIGKWHLGVKKEFMPLSHGFDEYFGIPYSVDMGISPWRMNGPWPPLPLIKGDEPIDQPVDLSTLSQRYADEAISFIKNAVESDTPFALYFPLNHVHVPDFSSMEFCNSSIRGFFGDAMQEMDWVIGQVMNMVDELQIGSNTLTFFTSDNGPWTIQKNAGGSHHLFRDGKHTTWEGGIRMPGIAHWPGMIDAMTISMELTATYDIFSTIINLAGNASSYLPTDRTYDGRDMSDIIFFNGKSLHECIYIYGGTPNTYVLCSLLMVDYSLKYNLVFSTDCPVKNETSNEYAKCAGLWSVRCDDYKAHWVTTHNGSVVIQDPPLLYNVNMDPSELHPIWPNNDQYPAIMARLTTAKYNHLATLEKGITNQMALGINNDTAFCLAPDSQKKYPQYPNCTANPETFESGFVCEPVCLDFDNCGPSQPGSYDTFYQYSFS